MREPSDMYNVAHECLLNLRETLLLPQLDFIVESYEPPYKGLTFNREVIADAKMFDKLAWNQVQENMTLTFAVCGDVTLFDVYPNTEKWRSVFHQLKDILMRPQLKHPTNYTFTGKMEYDLKQVLKSTFLSDRNLLLREIAVLHAKMTRMDVRPDRLVMSQRWYDLLDHPSSLYGMNVEVGKRERLRVYSAPEFGRYVEYKEDA